MCYDHESYCDQETRTVESCFPYQLSDNTSLINWCRQVKGNISLLLNPSCRFACDHRFDRLNLYPISENCPKDSTLYIVIALLAILAVSFLIYIMVTLRKCVCTHVYAKTKTNGSVDVTIQPPGEETEPHEMGFHPRGPREAGATDLADDRVLHADDSSSGRETRESQPLLENRDLNTNFVSDHPPGNSMDNRQTRRSSCHLSGTDSNISSPSSSAATLSARNDDSGISSEEHSRLDQAQHVQQSAYTPTQTGQEQGRTDYNTDHQSQGQRRPDLHFFTNPTVPDDGGKTVVTNISAYKRD